MATTVDGAADDAPASDAGGAPAVDDRRLLFGRWGLWLTLVGLVTLLAGILFGYDQGIISGALPFITSAFGLSSLLSEVVTSWVTLGALVGALAAGLLADRLGRRHTLMLAGAVFMVGAGVSGFAPDTAVLVVGRFIIGFGVGVASVAAPLYAAEMAPKETRAASCRPTSWRSRSASSSPTSSTTCSRPRGPGASCWPAPWSRASCSCSPW